MFIGRERELTALQNQYNSSKFEFTVIYGRRRVGKTAIINEFVKDKDVIYFTGVESNEKQNLENFSQSIMSYKSDLPQGSEFTSFQDALEFVFKLAQEKRIVLVIDEYPYVAKASKSLASTLQLMIDKHKDASKLFLILCGSSMSYMEDHVLAYKAPLYGRRTAQLKVQPFEFMEACKHFPKFAAEDKAIAYGIVGGTPQYLLQLDDGLSIKENIKKIFLNPSSFLFEEPTNLLKQEVREPAIYNAIITAIATGGTKLSEISSKVGEDTSVCATYIRNLISLGIVKKETPYGESSGRKTIYSIEDNMFRFWYRFVAENTSVNSRGADELAYKRIEPYLSDYMGAVFEDISKLISPTSVAGGVQIKKQDSRKKLTLWGYKTKLPPFSANVNGRMKKLTLLFLKSSSNEVSYSITRISTSIYLLNQDLLKVVLEKRKKWVM